MFILVSAYWAAIDDLIQRWSNEPEYSHGILIPFVSAWMIWSRRKTMENLPLRPHWVGSCVLIGCGLFAVIGAMTSALILQQLAFVTSLFGVSLIVGGWALTRLLVIPIGFLYFAVPLPYFAISILSWRLQLISSELGVAFVRLFNIPVFLDGNVIDLGVYKLGVVEACSGLRYLFPFLSLSFLAAYTARFELWKKAVVFLSAIPITIVMNSVRIGVIGILVYHFGIEHAEGFVHYFEGWVVFLFCLGILIIEVYLIAWLSGYRSIDLFALPEFQSLDFVDNQAYGRPRSYALIVSAVVLIGATGLLQSVKIGLVGEIPPSKRLVGLPYELGGWHVNQLLDLSPDVEQVLAADDYVVANLTNEAGEHANLYVAYLERKEGKQSWHSPRQCIPGGGWKILSLDRVETIDSYTGLSHPVNRVLIERNGVQQLVYYWFQQRGRRIASEWTVRYYVILDSILKGRTDGALVRVVTPIMSDERMEDSEARLKTFAAELTRHLPAYVPE